MKKKYITAITLTVSAVLVILSMPVFFGTLDNWKASKNLDIVAYNQETEPKQEENTYVEMKADKTVISEESGDILMKPRKLSVKERNMEVFSLMGNYLVIEHQTDITVTELKHNIAITHIIPKTEQTHWESEEFYPVG